MNVKKVKKIVKRIGSWVMFAIAITFTVTFIASKIGNYRAGTVIREQLSIARTENNKLRGEITSLTRQQSDDARRIEELEAIERRLAESSKALEELLRSERDNNSEAREDCRELEEIVQRDREAIARIRDILQDEDSEDSDS